MKYRAYISLMLAVCSFLLYFSCTGTRKASNQNLSTMYRRDASQMRPQLEVLHLDEGTSRLYFKIGSKSLLYTRQSSGDIFTAQVQISYRLTPSYESKDIIDSSTVKISDSNYNSDKEIIGYVDFRCREGANYLLEVNITDMNRIQSAKNFINVEKQNKNGRQYFFVSQEDAGYPLFKNYLDAEEKVTVRKKNAGKLYVRFYKRDFPLSAPPFSMVNIKPFNFSPDSFFVLTADDSGRVSLSLPRMGFYHFQSDTNIKEGITLFRYPHNFPDITTAEELFSPLRYIMTKHEYDEMQANPDKKLAVDNFWLSVSGSRERGKELIRKFYNRVYDANRYFSSYVEGWKTDRGMIYIVYGAPSAIYRASQTETWVYGDGGNSQLSVTFTFDKVDNPFSDNDFKLYRSTIYQNSWYKAVDLWRQGRVYLDY